MSHSVGVSGVSADLILHTASSSGSILHLGVVERLMFVRNLLLSGVGLHCLAGLGVGFIVSSVHIGCSEVVADGGDCIGDSWCLVCSSCLDGPLIAS
jgi:hypothetical protein